MGGVVQRASFLSSFCVCLCRLSPHHGPFGVVVGLWRVHHHGVAAPGGPSVGGSCLSAAEPSLHASLLRPSDVGGAAEQRLLGPVRRCHGGAALRHPPRAEGPPHGSRRRSPLLPLLRHRMVFGDGERSLCTGHALLCAGGVDCPASPPHGRPPAAAAAGVAGGSRGGRSTP